MRCYIFCTLLAAFATTPAIAGAAASTALSGGPVSGSQAAPVPSSSKLAKTVLVVSNLSELKSAMQIALSTTGGAEIRLNSGSYGALVWTNKNHARGRVYLVPNSSSRPIFSAMNLTNSKNIAVSGMHIMGTDRVLVYLNSTENVVFSGNLLTGAKRNQNAWDDGSAGAHVRFAKSVTVNENVFEDLRAGIYFQRSSKISFAYNTLQYIREGVNVAATKDLDIRGNLFRYFQPNVPNGEHPDSIQFWTSNETEGSTDVRIVENAMLHGGCAAIQGIFIRSERPEVKHGDITVQRNVYFGASKNAIAVADVDTALVENNVAIASPYSETSISRAAAQAVDSRCSGALRPAILSRGVDTTGHVIRRNIAAQIGLQNNATRQDNIEVGTNVGAAYISVFDAQPTGSAPALASFRTRSPSDARSRNIGLLSTFNFGSSATGRLALDRGLSMHKE